MLVDAETLFGIDERDEETDWVLRCEVLLNLLVDWVSLVQLLEMEDALPPPFPVNFDWPAISDCLLGWVLRCGFVLNVPAGWVSLVQSLATEGAVLLPFLAEVD